MATYLRCRINPGQFSGEFAIHGESHNKETFSMFASEKDVDGVNPDQESECEGWLRVEVLDRDENLSLVRLPGQTFGNGTTVTVLNSELCERSPREIA